MFVNIFYHWKLTPKNIHWPTIPMREELNNKLITIFFCFCYLKKLFRDLVLNVFFFPSSVCCFVQRIQWSGLGVCIYFDVKTCLIPLYPRMSTQSNLLAYNCFWFLHPGNISLRLYPNIYWGFCLTGWFLLLSLCSALDKQPVTFCVHKIVQN